MLEFLIYLAPTLTSIKYFLLFFIVIALIGSIIHYNTAVEAYTKGNKEIGKFHDVKDRQAFKTFIVLIIAFVFLPSEKTMYMMLGAHYLKKSDIPQKLELVINKKLDEYLK